MFKEMPLVWVDSEESPEGAEFPSWSLFFLSTVPDGSSDEALKSKQLSRYSVSVNTVQVMPLLWTEQTLPVETLWSNVFFHLFALNI